MRRCIQRYLIHREDALITVEERPMEPADQPRPTSRISGFYRMSFDERMDVLVQQGILADEDVDYLRSRRGGLPFEVADNMIENAIGVLELPLGLGLNFLIDGTDYVVPMAVEEPSVVAAVSHIAKLVRDTGGFETSYDSSTMIGQIQVVGCDDWEAARRSIAEHSDELMAKANTFDPGLVERGGGCVGMETRLLERGEFRSMLVIHLYVDCVDAMGANAINTMVEGIAADVEEITGGSVFLRILSNLADRRVARASCRIPLENLDWHGFEGSEVARGIELASQFAELDPYRAATHNKGIMNGVSPVAIATGNDWRAIEAGAHAFAARSGQYGPLATWRIDGDALVGEIALPLALGIVGGPIKIHPTVQLVHRILRIETAGELARVIAAVGLAQNLGALKALATEGIQRGHMSLHARSVAVTAGATDAEVDACVEALVECGEIKVDRAREILDEMRSG